MKKAYLLILISCISHMSVFSAQKETRREKQDREILKLINDGNRQEYEQKSREEKITTQLTREHSEKVIRLKQQHAAEIAIYEKKLENLMTTIEEQKRSMDSSYSQIQHLKQHVPSDIAWSIEKAHMYNRQNDQSDTKS